MKLLQKIFIVTIVLAAFWQIGSAGYIHAKALLAQQLLLNAWNKTLQGETRVKPWAWADTWPVARMEVPSQGKEMIILAGDSGRNLAFGPAYRFGTAKPGEQGVSLISAHRDTHFRFLKDIKKGDVITIETSTADKIFYKITGTKIVHQDYAQIEIHSLYKELVLVTCYPFNSIQAGTKLRLLVFAQEINTSEINNSEIHNLA